MSKKQILVSDHVPYREFKGEIEFITKDKNGNIVDRHIEPNIVKIYAKEIIAHRIPFSKVWNPAGGTGTGAWEASGIDPDEEFAAKYILFGASFDENGVALDAEDTRYYTFDEGAGTYTAKRLGPGAEFNGGLINAIPIADPGRPLKKIENVDFEETYQPAGTPLLQADVRPMSNIVLLETTLRIDEYNGLSSTDSDFFTITEVALAAGREIDEVGTCECPPEELFLEGSSDSDGLLISFSGTDVVTLDASESEIDLIGVGDSVKIVAAGGTAGSEDTLDQITPFYQVIAKSVGGRDIQLDRVPVDSDNNPLTGEAAVFRNTLRIFSHRILKVPVKKSVDFEILVRWRLIIN